MKKSWSRILSVGVSAGLLVLLYLTIDLGGVAAALARSHPGWLVVSVGLIVPLTCLRAIRFKWIAPSGAVKSVGEAVRLTLVASAVNVFAPAKAGDLVKSFFVTRSGAASSEVAISIVIYERLSDFFALAVCSVASWAISPPERLPMPVPAGLAIFAIGVLCGIAILSGSAAERVARLIAPGSSSGPGWRDKLARLVGSFPALHRSLAGRRTNLAVFSVGLWVLQLTQIWLFAVTLGIAIPFTACTSVAAIALVAGQLPFTFSGIGSRDLALVALLAPYASAETAAAMGILTVTRNLLPPLAGLPFLRPYLETLLAAGMRHATSNASVDKGGL